MKIDSDTPYYKAVVDARPVVRIDGTVIVKVNFCEQQRRTLARFYSDQNKAMKLKVGDKIYVCPYDGDARFEKKHKQAQ